MGRAISNINTARLWLRGMRPEDFTRYAEIWAMPEVALHVTGAPCSRGRAWDSFLRNAGHWQMTGFGQWAVIESATRRMIGQTGFFFAARAMGEDFDRFPEARWVLDPEAQGRGLAQEAAHAAHDWFDRIIPGPLVARVAERHASARALAAQLGYHEMRRTIWNGESVLLMKRAGPPPARQGVSSAG